MHCRSIAVLAALAASGWLQLPAAFPASAETAVLQFAQAGDSPSYRPPSRGAPGGRVGSSSRGGAASTLPTIEPLAPDSHSGLTANASPTLYFFVSRPVGAPIRFTLSAPGQARPLVETTLSAAGTAGIHMVRLADYRVQLQPGIPYTWSISIAVDPRAPSNDVVASATITRVGPEPGVDQAARAAPPARRAALYAQAGFWYDAVAGAADAAETDRHAALDALLDQVGLGDAASYDRSAPSAIR